MTDSDEVLVLFGKTRRSARRAYVRARELAATLGVERYGLRVKEIAAVLRKSLEAVSRMVSRGIVKRQDEAGFEQLYEELDRSIAESPGREAHKS